jgi:hypothetical protein
MGNFGITDFTVNSCGTFSSFRYEYLSIYQSGFRTGFRVDVFIPTTLTYLLARRTPVFTSSKSVFIILEVIPVFSSVFVNFSWIRHTIITVCHGVYLKHLFYSRKWYIRIVESMKIHEFGRPPSLQLNTVHNRW